MHPDKTDRPADHAALLRAVVQQFVERQMHPLADIRQFEPLALGLIDMVDASAAARIVRPLCLHPETPTAVFGRLLAKGGPCAELALEFAPALPRGDLMSAARHGSPALGRAVARRADLDREIVEALIRRDEAETRRALAANLGLRLDPPARRALAQAARDDRTLARLLLDRDDCQDEAARLFLAATRHERADIIVNASRRALVAGRTDLAPAHPALASRLDAAAAQNDSAALETILAEALVCGRAEVLALLSDVQGEALALALAALGVDADLAARIYLGVDLPAGQEPGRVKALTALVRAVPQSAAMEIVSALTGAGDERRSPVQTASARDSRPQAPGWRSSARGGLAPLRKTDQSA